MSDRIFMVHPRNNDNPEGRVRNTEQIDAAVRSGLHAFGAQSVEKLVTCTGTTIWYCGKFTVFLWSGDSRFERMGDADLADYVVRTMRFRILKGIK